MNSRNKRFCERLAALIRRGRSAVDETVTTVPIAKAIAKAIVEIAPRTIYSLEASHVGYNSHPSRMLPYAESLLWELENGFREDDDALAHAEVFGDFFESARHLLDNGYKAPAVVIAGSSLEAHLRLLAQKSGIEITKDDGTNKKASTLNEELAKSKVYDKMLQKLITAWQDMRNAAAHSEKTNDQFDEINVRGMIDGTASFIVNHPA